MFFKPVCQFSAKICPKSGSCLSLIDKRWFCQRWILKWSMWSNKQIQKKKRNPFFCFLLEIFLIFSWVDFVTKIHLSELLWKNRLYIYTIYWIRTQTRKLEKIWNVFQKVQTPKWKNMLQVLNQTDKYWKHQSRNTVFCNTRYLGARVPPHTHWARWQTLWW